MKIKLAAYATAAALIGFAIMMLPLAFRIDPTTYKTELVNPFEQYRSTMQGGNEQRDQPDATFGSTSVPGNMLPSGLILIAGLAVALVAYASLRKQLK